jgi:hypothetical protein
MTDKVVWLNNHGGCFPFTYGFCPNERAYKRAVKKLGIQNPPPYPKTDGTTMELARGDDEKLALVFIGADDLKSSPLAIFALLVHEATHVFDLLCVSMGERDPSAEFKAYTVQMFAFLLIGAYIRTRRPKLTNLLVTP